MVKATFKPSAKTKKQQEDLAKMKLYIEASKLIAMYVLRNEGWGSERLRKFNDKWNGYMDDIDDRWISIADIEGVLKEEVGIGFEEIRVG